MIIPAIAKPTTVTLLKEQHYLKICANAVIHCSNCFAVIPDGY